LGGDQEIKLSKLKYLKHWSDETLEKYSLGVWCSEEMWICVEETSEVLEH
jgi:hypothetical protein